MRARACKGSRVTPEFFCGFFIFFSQMLWYNLRHMKNSIQSILLVVLTFVFCAVFWRILAFNAKNDCNVLTGRPPAARVAETNAQSVVINNPSEKQESTILSGHERRSPTVESTPQPGRVREIEFVDDETCPEIRIDLDREPKQDGILQSVTIEPAVENLSVKVGDFSDSSYGWPWRVSLASPNFLFRTNYLVTVKSTFPFADGTTLSNEVRRTFCRRDLDTCVRFADFGRYLPSFGARELALNLVNVTNIDCAVASVLPENVVQLLAREEDVYTDVYRVRADSRATFDLAKAPTCWSERVDLAVNTPEKRVLRLGAEQGVVSNGIYLVSVRDSNCRSEYLWHMRNMFDYRLVCVTDLALSLRKDSKSLRLWVTSLSAGRPLAGLDVRLYAASRACLATGETNEEGEFVFSSWDAREIPFAVVVSKKDGSDATFMALRSSMEIDETLTSGGRKNYLDVGEAQAFIWSDRGIYRPGERMMVHALLRDHAISAPTSFPVVVSLVKPDGKTLVSKTCRADAFGSLVVDDFVFPVDQPTGKWRVKLAIPGECGEVLGSRVVKVEDFVPPLVRVSVEDLPDMSLHATNLQWRVKAENLYGGPATLLKAESRVVFTDAPFAPTAFSAFRFGDAELGLKPNQTELASTKTDERGEATFACSFNEAWGAPKAAMRLLVQGAVVEANGRAAYARASAIVHRYPYYIGSDVPKQIVKAPGAREIRVVLVNPDGTLHTEARELKVELLKIDYVHNLRSRNGSLAWESTRVTRRVPCAESVQIAANGEGAFALPISGQGDYELVLSDEARGLSHRAAFWISDTADEEVHTSLENPARVLIMPDKNVYREGDRPRLTIKAPFPGAAYLTVMRENVLSTRVLMLTNATSVVELESLDAAWAPNVDVAVSVVRAIKATNGAFTSRAHGIAALAIRPRRAEIPVTLAAVATPSSEGGSTLDVNISAVGADRVCLTVVDEGVHLLTTEPVPNPIATFAILREGCHPLYDLFSRVLPVYDGTLKAIGAKTGGGSAADLFNRVSPVPTRRFKPLSLWKEDVPLTNGVATVRFHLPEFAGEVRVTAVAYSKVGTGACAIKKKVAPRLIMQCDAPRFVAPGDQFDLTLVLVNRSGKASQASYALSSDGTIQIHGAPSGSVTLAANETKTLRFAATSARAVGEGHITFRTTGCGETHCETVDLPIRPAVSWAKCAEVIVLKPGETKSLPAVSGTFVDAARRRLLLSGTPTAELVSALDYLADYPYGCLEQTVSRLYPLLTGDVFLTRLSTNETSKAEERTAILAGGVARVASMVRENGFTMWPDVNVEPWDLEVSAYAARFLIEASEAGIPLSRSVRSRVMRFLQRWVYSGETNVCAAACEALVLARAPNRDRMFSLYDARASLSLLARARLARGFIRLGEMARARELVSETAFAPTDVEEAAEALLALLEIDATDPRVGRLVLDLQARRDRTRFHWGTTRANAAALHALGAYYRVAGLGEGTPEVTVTKDGASVALLQNGERTEVAGGAALTLANTGKATAFVSLDAWSLPNVESITNAHQAITIERTFWTMKGEKADLKNVTRGDILIGAITLAADCELSITDLVIQDLLPAGLEPDSPDLASTFAALAHAKKQTWVLRDDIRDDRVLVFSRPVTLSPRADGALTYYYAVRAVSSGTFVLPGVRVEAMYAPEIFAETAPRELVIKP